MRKGISILLAVIITAALSAGAHAAVNVVDFGAVSGGSATANAAAFQAAHDALPVTGGVIVIPGGDFNVNGATIQVTKPVIWQGQGYGSRVISDSFTLTLFNVATTKGVTFRDFFIDSSVSKTAGAGIVAQGDGTIGLCGSLAGGGCGSYGITVRSMLIRNQYVGIDLEDACNAYIVNNIVTESYNYALKVTTVNNPSASSNMINGNTFASQRPGGKAALIGSGIDAVNNTFYGTGSPVVEFNTVAAGNDVARLVGNHIEGNTGVAVALKVNPTGYLSRLIISGNTIDAETTAILLSRARLQLRGRGYRQRQPSVGGRRDGLLVPGCHLRDQPHGDRQLLRFLLHRHQHDGLLPPRWRQQRPRGREQLPLQHEQRYDVYQRGHQLCQRGPIGPELRGVRGHLHGWLRVHSTGWVVALHLRDPAGNLGGLAGLLHRL